MWWHDEMIKMLCSAWKTLMKSNVPVIPTSIPSHEHFRCRIKWIHYEHKVAIPISTLHLGWYDGPLRWITKLLDLVNHTTTYWPPIHEVGRVAELTARSLSSAANSDCSYYTRTSQQVDWPTICLSWTPFKIDQWPYLTWDYYAILLCKQWEWAISYGQQPVADLAHAQWRRLYSLRSYNLALFFYLYSWGILAFGQYTGIA